MYKLLTILSLLLIAILYIGAGKLARSSKWLVENDCSLSIEGKTNINSFCCSIDNYCYADTLCIKSSSTDCYVFSSNEIMLDARKFNCGNKLISHDFRKTIHASVYPLVKISFISIGEFPILHGVNNHTTAKINISLGGASADFTVKLFISPINDSSLILKGNRYFSFSDFNLRPPHLSAGLIKVKKDLQVNFQMVLRKI